MSIYVLGLLEDVLEIVKTEQRPIIGGTIKAAFDEIVHLNKKIEELQAERSQLQDRIFELENK